MFYKFNYTMPTLKIKSSKDYRQRVNEILFWQLKETVQLKTTAFISMFQIRTFEDFLYSLFFVLWAIITLPFTLLYFILCITELVVETLLFPIYLIPILRIVPIVITTIIWALSLGIGIFAGAAIEKQ